MLSRTCLGATTEAQIVAALMTPCTLLEMHRKAGTKKTPKNTGPWVREVCMHYLGGLVGSPAVLVAVEAGQ